MKHNWWDDKIAYQIYPKSFYDSNNDGIGDIRGIIEKLDYLQDLGINLLWISPFYPSPLADNGYDISDYYGVDPRFGSMADLDELINLAKEKDIDIILDLVVNHCSDEHEWFKKACADPDGPFGKFFYIEDYIDGENLPTNWRSYFGGSCWEKLPGHDDKVYMHVFHKKQPDLNWENPDLRQELYKMINWWLEKGIAGFRIDAISNIKKHIPYKNYPVDREDGLASMYLMLQDTHGIGEFLQEMADNTFKKYYAFTVGEVCDEKDSELQSFIGNDGYFSSMFDFSASLLGIFDDKKKTMPAITGEDYKNAIFTEHKKLEGIGRLSNIIENHDQPRGVSHYIPMADLNDKSKKMLAGIYFMLPGIPFIYQGQEIGMENLDSVDNLADLDDCANEDLYTNVINCGLSKEYALQVVAKFSRDNARTPFQWSNEENAGFSKVKPWLMVNPKYKTINYMGQKDNPDSVFNFYKALINLRKDPLYKDIFIYGSFTPYEENTKNLVAYLREYEGKTLLILANFQNKELQLTLPKNPSNLLISNTGNEGCSDTTLALEPYDYYIFEL